MRACAPAWSREWDGTDPPPRPSPAAASVSTSSARMRIKPNPCGRPKVPIEPCNHRLSLPAVSVEIWPFGATPEIPALSLAVKIEMRNPSLTAAAALAKRRTEVARNGHKRRHKEAIIPIESGLG